ncbi:MAG: type II toxin-antitoxin system RelE/ParE family toxin [Chitinophagaceae bacterium]
MSSLRKVVIEKEVTESLREIYNFVRPYSEQYAEKIRDIILDSIKQLQQYPEKYPPDKYKYDNDGAYRAYEIYSYRITYVIVENEIWVIRIRHTKMRPFSY